MDNIMQKAAFLKGLAEGMELDTTTKENKLILALIELVDEMACTLASVEDATAEIEDELDEIAEELIEIENQLDECCDYDDCDCDCDDCDCDDCDDCDCDDDSFYYEVTCPTCNECIALEESIVAAGGITCPSCGEDLEFEFDEDDECDCGHCH